MRRNFGSSDFSNSEFESEEENDPRVGLVNLADVMLVFACGLMLALVAYWNLDVSFMQELTQGEEMSEVQDIEEIKGDNSGGGGFIEKGVVYQDPMTGKFYMLEEDLSGGGQKAEEGNTTQENTNQENNATQENNNGQGNNETNNSEVENNNE